MRHFFAKKSWAIAHVRQRASPMFFVACSVKTGGVGVGAQEENSEKSTVNAQEKGERDDRGVHHMS